MNQSIRDELDTLRPAQESELQVRLRLLANLTAATANVRDQKVIDDDNAAAHEANIVLSSLTLQRKATKPMYKDTFQLLYGVSIHKWDNQTMDLQSIKDTLNIRGQVYIARQEGRILLS